MLQLTLNAWASPVPSSCPRCFPAACTHTQLSPPLTVVDKHSRTAGAPKAAALSSYISFLHLIRVAVPQTVRGCAGARRCAAEPQLSATSTSRFCRFHRCFAVPTSNPLWGSVRTGALPSLPPSGAAGLLMQPCLFLCCLPTGLIEHKAQCFRIKLKTRMKTKEKLASYSGFLGRWHKLRAPLVWRRNEVSGGPGEGRHLTFARGGDSASFSTRMGGLMVISSCRTPGSCQS